MTAIRLASGREHRLVVEVAWADRADCRPWRSNRVSWRAWLSRIWAMMRARSAGIPWQGWRLGERRGEQQGGQTTAAAASEVLFMSNSSRAMRGAALTQQFCGQAETTLPSGSVIDAEQARCRAVARAAGFGGDRLADGVLDVVAVDVAGAEEARRRPLDRPCLGRGLPGRGLRRPRTRRCGGFASRAW